MASALDQSGSRGVLVVGMHRSGTSAAARVLNLLGLPLCRAEDLMSQPGGNPRGHWESQTMMCVNERLLHALGAQWDDVPGLTTPLAAWHKLAPYAHEARRIFLRLHPTSTWVWKDPRLCVLLPFWRTLLGCDPVIVLVVRDPLEIAASLATRQPERLSQAIYLQQWELNLRHALAGCEGAPTYVLHYAQLLEDADAVCSSLAAFLKECNIPTDADIEAVRSFLDPELRHTKEAGLASNKLTIEQRSLLRTLLRLEGPYSRFNFAIHTEQAPLPTAWLHWFERALERGCNLDQIRATAILNGLTSVQTDEVLSRFSGIGPI